MRFEQSARLWKHSTQRTRAALSTFDPASGSFPGLGLGQRSDFGEDLANILFLKAELERTERPMVADFKEEGMRRWALV